MQGWLKLHRQLLEWEWADDPYTSHLFMHLLLEARHKEFQHHGYILSPGQVIYKRKPWAKKTGISEQSLRTCLTRLVASKQVTIKSTNKYSVLTIENWGKYQSFL